MAVLQQILRLDLRAIPSLEVTQDEVSTEGEGGRRKVVNPDGDVDQIFKGASPTAHNR
jgi:hypothetical protein